MSGRVDINTTLKIIDAGDASANITSSQANVPTDRATFEFNVTGSPVGTVQVQGTVSESNWTNLPMVGDDGIPVTSIAVSAAVTHHMALKGLCNFVSLRMTYTFTSGTGTVNAWIRQ